MLNHLLKLTWKRKARNLMLSFEILLAFVLVFAIAAYAVRSIQLYTLPIGFTFDDVWAVEMNTGTDELNTMPAIYDSFQHALEEMPQVEHAAFAGVTPFTRSSFQTDVKDPVSGARVRIHQTTTTDNYASVAGIRLAEGRWFSKEDDGAAAVPVVINRRLADSLFPHASAIGKTFGGSGTKDRVMRVVGVVEEYRGWGDLSAPVNAVLTRYTGTPDEFPPTTILLKLKPGTVRSFEVALQRKLNLVRNNWTYKVTPLRELRSTMLRTETTPLIVLAIVAAFMLAMVAFGLFGVLWQNTTQRIPEIGLRRAIGATATNIYRQIVAEQLLLSSFAMIVGLVLLVQLPLTGAMDNALNWKVFSAAAAISMAVIYLISLLCALYPGWRASRLSPTEALHYE